MSHADRSRSSPGARVAWTFCRIPSCTPSGAKFRPSGAAVGSRAKSTKAAASSASSEVAPSLSTMAYSPTGTWTVGLTVSVTAGSGGTVTVTVAAGDGVEVTVVVTVSAGPGALSVQPATTIASTIIAPTRAFVVLTGRSWHGGGAGAVGSVGLGGARELAQGREVPVEGRPAPRGQRHRGDPARVPALGRRVLGDGHVTDLGEVADRLGQVRIAYLECGGERAEIRRSERAQHGAQAQPGRGVDRVVECGLNAHGEAPRGAPGPPGSCLRASRGTPPCSSRRRVSGGPRSRARRT